MITIEKLRQNLERKKGKAEQIELLISQARVRIKKNTQNYHLTEKAHEIIKEVGIKTQVQLSYNISEIVGMAMEAVLDNAYSLELDFVDRRNKPECDIYFIRDKVRINPYFAGGGAKDVASFALRVAAWSMSVTKSRSILILDEPFSGLKGEGANKRMLEMISEVSKRLRIQIIMVADERVSRETLLESIDRLFDVSIKKKVTQINIEL